MKKIVISKAEVKHVAKLAHLKLSTRKLEIYTKQLQAILGYVKDLSHVNTSSIKPTYQTIDDTVNIFRKDNVSPSLSQKSVLSQSKSSHKGFFVVDNVFEKKDEVKKTNNKKSKKRVQIDKYNAALTLVNTKGTIGHKDLFMTQGVETTAGSAVLSGYKAHYSAVVVKQLEAKGFKTKYKLNQDAWGHGSSGENSDFGPTQNPWDQSRTPGGSSSGSAVAVAQGLVEAATGTDTCGSIRLPSNYTGVVGIKPTYGAISRYGVIAFASSLDCPGVIARSVKEVRKFFNIVSQADKNDANSLSKARYTPSDTKTIKTIGIPEEFFGKGLDKQVEKTIKKAIDTFSKNGFKIKSVSLPHTKYAVAAYYLINPTETSSNLARYTGVRYGNSRDTFGSEAERRIMLGTFASSAGYADRYYEQAAKVRTLIVEDFSQAFSKVDAILGPVAPTPPFKLGEKVGDPLKMYLTDVYAAPVSLSGIPALALPCGFTTSGLPIGMQLIGPRWSEEKLFDAGEKYQQVTDWHKQKPKAYEK